METAPLVLHTRKLNRKGLMALTKKDKRKNILRNDANLQQNISFLNFRHADNAVPYLIMTVIGNINATGKRIGEIGRWLHQTTKKQNILYAELAVWSDIQRTMLKFAAPNTNLKDNSFTIKSLKEPSRITTNKIHMWECLLSRIYGGSVSIENFTYALIKQKKTEQESNYSNSLLMGDETRVKINQLESGYTIWSELYFALINYLKKTMSILSVFY